jgi:hypothetical protein
VSHKPFLRNGLQENLFQKNIENYSTFLVLPASEDVGINKNTRTN